MCSSFLCGRMGIVGGKNDNGSEPVPISFQDIKAPPGPLPPINVKVIKESSKVVFELLSPHNVYHIFFLSPVSVSTLLYSFYEKCLESVTPLRRQMAPPV